MHLGGKIDFSTLFQLVPSFSVEQKTGATFPKIVPFGALFFFLFVGILGC
jgi:hypothetical protein